MAKAFKLATSQGRRTTTHGGSLYLSAFLSSPTSPPHGFERIKTMEVLGLWSKSQEAHGFGGILAVGYAVGGGCGGV
uniref:Uncharacterized protein n=1 Tax=Fagus sylvatica TaxID=28930 RepID=A0A2N9GJ47_FAGSY